MVIRLFVADDHAVMRDGLTFLLNAQPDIQVVGGAANGHAAVQQIQVLLPDVVIMDIAMPELNGIDATYQLLAACPATQVIILSMYGSPGYIYRAFQAGAVGYLLKESAGDEVVEAIRAVHAGRRYLSRGIAETILDDYMLKRRAAAEDEPLDRLSARERELLQLLVEGRSKTEIARILSLAPKTVDTYHSRLMQKLGLHDLPALVKFAIRHGLIRVDA